MIMAFLATKAGKIVGGVLGILLVLGLVYALGKCSDSDADVAAQVEQTNRSGEAVANAAEMAIDKIGDRTLTDGVVDQAVAEVTQEIGHAESVDAVRGAVIDGMCGQPEFRNDPACRVRQTDPR
jgi:hypothetical protein